MAGSIESRHRTPPSAAAPGTGYACGDVTSDRGRGAAQALRQGQGRRGRVLRRARGRDLRLDRPQRRRQDDDARVRGGTARARCRPHPAASGSIPCAMPPRCRRASACSCRSRTCRSGSRSGRPSISGPRCTAQPVDGARLLEQLGLHEKRHAWFMTLSGGQKQRLFIALALIHDPGSRLPRRAHDRPRSAGPPRDLGAGARHPHSRQDRGPDDAPDGGSRAPLRSRRHHRQRPPRRHRHTRAHSCARHCPERMVAITTDDDRAAALLTACRSVARVEHGVTDAARPRHAATACSTTCSRAWPTHRVHVTGVQSQSATLEDVFLRLTGHSDPELGPMLRGLWKLTWLETKIFLREPLGVIGTHRLPDPAVRAPAAGLGRGAPRAAAAAAPGSDLPIIAAVMVAVSAVVSLVAIIAIYREGGILKRLRATPLQPVTILLAHVIVKLGFTALSLAGAHRCVGARYVRCRPAARRCVSFARRPAVHDAVPAVDRLHHRERRADGAIRAATGDAGRLHDAGILGTVRAGRPAAAAMQAIARVLPMSHAVSLLRGDLEGRGLARARLRGRRRWR